MRKAAAQRVPLPEISAGAAVGVVKLDGAFGIGIGGRVDQHPAVGAHAGVAIANGLGERRVAGFGRVFSPGEQKVVLGAVGLGERDLHSGWTCTAVP